MDDSPTPASPPPRSAEEPARRQLSGRLGRLALKELREILRDRRTIVTLVVMPLVIYPLLALVFQRFLLTSIKVAENEEYVIGVESSGLSRILGNQIRAGDDVLRKRGETDGGQADEHGNAIGVDADGRLVLPGNGSAGGTMPVLSFYEVGAADVARHMADSSLHLAVLARHNAGEDEDEGLNTPMTWELVYRVGSPTSEAALAFVESRLRAFSESQLDQQLRQLNVAVALPASTTRRAVDFAGAPMFSLAALIPLILVLMTVTGAVYPAIDLTAGERERGTLETLIAAPVPRVGLLFAKYIAVLTVALLTAIINLVGMTITAHSTGLAGKLFGTGGMSLVVVLKILLLLGLFAAFFSAILLAVTSYARSFKEAQAYIIPLMLLCLVPGVICLMPGLQFTGWLAVTPLVNMVLLARDVLEGSVVPRLAVAAVCSTAFYIAAAIALAARIFGTDAVLYGSQSTWSDLWQRPTTSQAAPTMQSAMLALALMFPCYFLLANSLASSQELTLQGRLLVGALVTGMVFGGIPIALATIGRVRASSGLGLRRPGMIAVLASAVLGLALWPAAHEIFLFSGWLGIAPLDTARLAAAKSLVDMLQVLSPALVLTTLALVPGVFEELCFRGFLYGALRTVLGAGQTILATAVLFGLFHEALGPGRLLPSTFMGLVLGWVRWRTGSIFPCIVLHVVHNGLLLSVSHWRDKLAEFGIGVEDRAHLPLAWHAAAAVAVFVGVVVLVVVTKRGRGARARVDELARSPAGRG